MRLNASQKGMAYSNTKHYALLLTLAKSLTAWQNFCGFDMYLAPDPQSCVCVSIPVAMAMRVQIGAEATMPWNLGRRV